MRFQVPQFVDIEDKIIGPFTLRQFLIYIAAVMVLIPVYTMSDLSLFLTIAIPIAGIAVAFAHVKIYSRSLFAVITSAITYATRGQMFIWHRTGTVKLLPIRGEEFAHVDASFEDSSISLQQRARFLDTTGKVVTEDLEDPLIEDTASKN